MNSCDFPFFEGFITGLSLIIAIGPQNTFVLKQGLLKNRVFLNALFCSFVDSLLIGLGVTEFGALLASSETMLFAVRIAGGLFLSAYGLRCFIAILRPPKLDISKQMGAKAVLSLKQNLLILGALGFLNPHAYIDTFMLIGGIGAQYPLMDQSYFALGAIAASWFWFFSLSYGAKAMAPYLTKDITWKVLDAFTGCVMWMIAYSLFFPSQACSI